MLYCFQLSLPDCYVSFVWFTGSSVCNGDSGGGMVFPRNSSDGSVTWMLRGIVSLSKPKGMIQPVCDPTNFVVFTDAAKYLDWIQNHIKW